MARCRLIAALFCVLVPTAAYAQASAFTGFLTGSIGRARGGDVRDGSWSPGISMAVVESSGWGAELDLAYVPDFDRSRFAESRIITGMLNVTWVWTDPTALVRPYAVGGVGLLRARACVIDCEPATTHTDVGFNAGGGVFVLFNETLGARVDVRYLRSFQRHSDPPLTTNGALDLWRISVGGTLSWPMQ